MRQILIAPSKQRRNEFLAAVKRSRELHRHWAEPPRTAEAFDAYLARLKKPTHIGYWVRTEANELAGVININEIVRGKFLSGYLGYYAFGAAQWAGLYDRRPYSGHLKSVSNASAS